MPDVAAAWASPPVAAADAVIACALRTGADVAWIEPSPLEAERYVVSMEQQGRQLAQVTVDAHVATAVIARLAYIAGVDLSEGGPVTGVAKLRGLDDRERDLVLTVRTGRDLRAEAMFVARTGRPSLGVLANEVAPGDRVDHYRLLSRLGTGGMGTVFAAEHVTLDRRYALKIMSRETIARDKETERFLREARAAGRLKHPNIVDVFDFGYLTDGRPYFVMELLDGKSIAEMLDERRRIGHAALLPDRAVNFMIQLAEALATAHDGGVVHADVSSNNVIVIDDAKLKLVDFGLAELRDNPLAASDYVVGTPDYVAPELLRGGQTDELSDQYSFGCLLFEMIHGEPPFEADSVAQTCRRHLDDPVPTLTSPHGALPAELIDLVARCLNKVPAARYPDMRAVAANLVAVARKLAHSGWRRFLP
jgi:serine/threonine protein kinase